MLVNFEIDLNAWKHKRIIPEAHESVRVSQDADNYMIEILLDSKGWRTFHCCENIAPGVYEVDLNFDNVIAEFYPNSDQPFIYECAYGLCDNYQQAINTFSKYANSENKYCLFVTPIYREDQPEKYGFRYHKWGDYIGTQWFQHTYLYDDKHIDVIYSFKFIKLS